MMWVFLLAFSYLLGSVPTGLVIARLLGAADPRAGGSGNIGATNVGRTLGRGAGVATLVGDSLKGFLPTAWAYGALGSPWAVATVGLAAFLGHLFPVYLGFKGGKGVATGLGVFLAVAPGAVLWAGAVFALVVWKSGMVSLASMTAAAALPLVCAFFQAPLAVVTLALAVAGLIVWRHRGNIQRILAGSENRVGRRV